MIKTHRIMPFFLFGIAMLIVSACSTTVRPETPREALASAEIVFQGTLVSTQIVADQGLLTVDEARVLAKAFTNIKVAIDLARLSIATGDSGVADRNIRVANTILKAVAIELGRIQSTRDPPPPRPEEVPT